MQQTTQLKCACGKTAIDVQGSHIASVECCCNSCREASLMIEGFDGAPRILTDYDATPFVMFRKDRVQFVSGENHLKEIRLSPTAKTRRVVATCCNTPMFLEFSHGHWLSIYAGLWPKATCPPLEMRTMAMDLPMDKTLPDNVPNAKRQSVRFFLKLLGAWVAMGFRIPKMPATERLDS